MSSRNAVHSYALRLLTRALLLAAACGALRAQTKLLRFPDIHDNRIVFSYGGDLWLVGAGGGLATRLTAHSGVELFAKFSPDGKWIAFTGQYDGDEQVYVIPSTGGEPRQLTFYPSRGPLAPRWGYDNQVYGWTNDGHYVIFRTLRDGWALGQSRLYRVSIDGGPSEPLPMPVAGSGSLSPGGNEIVYSPQARDFRPEKRYSGGTANQLYIFDLETHAAKLISEGPRSSRDPMWIGRQIYFNSDKDGHFNLYAYDVASGKTTEVTHNTVWDVRWPSSDRERRIVYELDGELQVLDIRTGKSTPISVNVPDDGINRRPSYIAVANHIEDAELSPKGERVLFTARGDIFSAPVEHGPTRNLTHSPGAHDKWPMWSPDGAKVAYISDATGEEELYVVAQDGSTPAEQITTGGKAMRYEPRWSPDGQRLAFSDKDGRLWVVSLADRKPQEVAHSTEGGIRDYAWSPGGSYIAFSMPNSTNVSVLYIWSLQDGKLHQVTNGLFDESSPAWDPKGDYLYYMAVHEFHPQISQIEFDFATNRSRGIFVLALRNDVKSPFPLESDEVTIKKDGPAKADGSKDKDKPPAESKDAAAKDANKDKDIDFDGLASRVTRVPVEADNYFGLAVKSDSLIYATLPARYYGRDAQTKPALHIFAFKDRKDTRLVDDIGAFVLSRDGSKVLVRQGAAWNMYDATPTGASTKKTVSTDGLDARARPRPRSGKRSSTRCGAATAISSTRRTCTATIGKPCGHRYSQLLPYVAHRGPT